MTEINNNIPGFGIHKINNPEPKQNTEVQEQKPEVHEREYLRDPGVLGRSQVKPHAGGANIAASVDEAVDIATNQSGLLCGSETVFNSILKDLLDRGVNYEDAYMQALLAEEEFIKMGKSCIAYNR